MTFRKYEKFGKRYGLLTVINPEPERRRQDGLLWWECECDCGVRKWVRAKSLVPNAKGTKSCGCARNLYNNSEVAKLKLIEGRKIKHQQEQDRRAYLLGLPKMEEPVIPTEEIVDFSGQDIKQKHVEFPPYRGMDRTALPLSDRPKSIKPNIKIEIETGQHGFSSLVGSSMLF